MQAKSNLYFLYTTFLPHLICTSDALSQPQVRFSKHAVCHGHPSGYWAISMRVANLRKHQILQPTIRLVVTAVDSITPSNYIFEHLKVDSLTAQVREGALVRRRGSGVVVL